MMERRTDHLRIPVRTIPFQNGRLNKRNFRFPGKKHLIFPVDPHPRPYSLVISKLSYESPAASRVQADGMRKNPIAQKRHAGIAFVQLDVFLQIQGQFRLQKILESGEFGFQSMPAMAEKREIVHVPQIGFHFPMFLGPVVELPQVVVGQVLGDRVSDGNALAGRLVIRVQDFSKQIQQQPVLELSFCESISEVFYVLRQDVAS